MAVLRNVTKNRKESTKSLHQLDKKSIRLKSKEESSKLHQKNVKDKAKRSLESMHVEALESGKVHVSSTKEIERKPNLSKRVSLRSHQKGNISKLGEESIEESKKHVISGKNSKKQVERNTVKEGRINRNTRKNKGITLSKSTTIGKLQSSKRKKTGNDGDEENADTLNLNDLSKEHIKQCISIIFHLTEEQLKNKNALFDGENNPVFMQVTCIKVPKTPKRCMRILLPHSIVSPNDEIALFVGDLQKGRRKDYEPTVEHYEDLLRKHGCKCIKTIIPMNQVKTEYDQYELKRKLVNSYDHFLVDGKIAGHLSHLLGKEFYKKRKLPTSIKMQSKDLKHEIEYALRKTAMQIHSFGDSHIVQVGHTGMEMEEILENILEACNSLAKNYPGGWNNIRSVRIKTNSSLALPIYTTLKNKNSVEVPLVEPKRPKAYREVSGEITTIAGSATVTVTPEGDITIKKKLRRVMNRRRDSKKETS